MRGLIMINPLEMVQISYSMLTNYVHFSLQVPGPPEAGISQVHLAGQVAGVVKDEQARWLGSGAGGGQSGGMGKIGRSAVINPPPNSANLASISALGKKI